MYLLSQIKAHLFLVEIALRHVVENKKHINLHELGMKLRNIIFIFLLCGSFYSPSLLFLIRFENLVFAHG